MSKFIKRLFLRSLYFFALGSVNGSFFLIRSLIMPVTTVTPPGMKTPLTIRTRTSDLLVFEHVFITSEMKHLFNLIGSPATIIDAGANTGMTTARFAIQYPQAKIIAIEPEPENFKLLKENTRSLPNVTCICGALWYKSTRIQIFDPKKSNYSFQVGAEASETDPHAVQTYTVDELIDMFGTGSVDFLKIDIEGAERDIFERPVDAWLKQIGIISIELHEKIKPGCSYHLMKQAVSRRFTMRGIGEKVILKFDDTPEVH